MHKYIQDRVKQFSWQRNNVVEQAIVRVLFSIFLLVYSYVSHYYNLFGHAPAGVIYVCVMFFMISTVFLLVMGFVPQPGKLSKLTGMIMDIGFATYALTIGNSSTAFLYGIYLWIIIGNGLRFGRNYLYLANALCIIAFPLVITYSEFWRTYNYVGYGLMIWLLLMPLYIGKLLKKLEGAIEQADSANKAKSIFLANMSHEIRTPLTAIVGYADTGLEEDLNHAQRMNALHIIQRSGDHLLGLINDILDFSKIDANELIVEHIAMNPLQVVADVEFIVQSQAEKKQINFSVDYEFPLPVEIYTDPVRLKQILLNLCNNAVKFTQKGSVYIKMQYDRDTRDLIFTVTDTGIGMTPDQLAVIFQPFKQADSSTSRRFGGTGLGLSLSKQLTRLLGGKLTVQSELQKGTTFELSIPTGIETEQNLVNSKSEIKIELSDRKTRTDLPRLKGNILLAEDNIVNQKLIVMFLSKMGANVFVANDGRQAIAMALENNFDLVYMDMQMPIMSGIDAVRELRAKKFDKPIVALTANATREDKQLCISAGCNDFLSKPIEREMLYKMTAQYLKRDENTTSDQTPIVSSLLVEDPEMADLVTVFIDNLPDMLNRVYQAYSKENWQALKEAVHSLKGSGGNFGFLQISEIARKIELQMKQNQYDSIARLLKDMDALCQRITNKKTGT